MNEQNPDVKIIRLNTGEDIIGNCLFDNNTSTLLIDSPMKVVLQRSTDYGKAMLVMMPWLPLEVIEENIATLSYNDVITIIIPKQSFVEFYTDTLERYEALVNDSENNRNTFEDEMEEEIDDDELLEMIEALKESKNKSIH